MNLRTGNKRRKRKTTKRSADRFADAFKKVRGTVAKDIKLGYRTSWLKKDGLGPLCH
jgi:hypothetical protein